MSDWIWGIAYLLFSISGFCAVLLYFINPTDGRKGIDVTWCGLLALAAFNLVPMVNVSSNLFWLVHLWRKLGRLRLPKCRVAIKGRMQ